MVFLSTNAKVICGTCGQTGDGVWCRWMLDIKRMAGMIGLVYRGGIEMHDHEWIEMDMDQMNDFFNAAHKLATEILTLNPASGELGEGKARRLIELAEEVLNHD